MALRGGAASRTPLLGRKIGTLQPYTRTVPSHSYTTGYQKKASRPNYGGLVRGFQAQATKARQANLARQKRIEGIYSSMLERYQPGGAFEKGGLAQIETARTKGVGQEMQHMIGSGMYGTSTAAGVGRKWEADVGAPARLRLEDIMGQRRTGIQQQKAGFLERIQQPYPDYSALMGAIAG